MPTVSRHVIGALALTAAVASPAAATHRYQVVAPASPVHDAFSVSADVGFRGGAVVGWTDDGGSPRAMAALRPRAGARFTPPRRLGPGRMAQVAIAPNGAMAFAAWVTPAGLVRFSTADSRGRWRADPMNTLPTGATQSVVGLVAGSRGRATALIEQRAPSEWRLFVLRRDAGGWTLAARLTAPDVGGGNASVSRTGEVLATWLARDGDDSTATRLQASRLPAGDTRWTTADTLARSDDGSMSQPFADLAPDGTALVLAAARSTMGSSADATAFVARPGSGWSSLPVDATASVGLAPSGRLWAARVASGTLEARTTDDGGRWISPERIGRVGAARVSAGPATQAAWDTVAAWWVVSGGRARPDRWVASVRGPAGWSAPATVGATAGVASFAGSPGGLVAAFVDAARGGRVALVEIHRPR